MQRTHKPSWKQLTKLALALAVVSLTILAVQIIPMTQAQGYPPRIPTIPPSTATPIPTATPQPSPTIPTVSASPTEFPWNFQTSNPTYNPSTKSSSFWSPLTIGIVAVAVVAFAIPVAFFFLRRGKAEPLPKQETPIKTPERPMPNSPVSSRYPSYSYSSQQTTRPGQPTRYGSMSSYRQQPPSPYSTTTVRSPPSSSVSRPAPYSKTCPNCKRAVSNDRNVCPYCYKRIK